MQAPSELDKAVEYTKQFIEAMTPIAKQAYEVGLFTLRIDAAQSLVMSLFFLIVCFFIIRRIQSDWAAAVVKGAENKDRYSMGPNEHLPMLGVPHGFIGIGAAVFGFAAAYDLVNIWNWTKLFAPQLWLAHHAIEKFIK